jgi:hypothetical protein
MLVWDYLASIGVITVGRNQKYHAVEVLNFYIFVNCFDFKKSHLVFKHHGGQDDSILSTIQEK